MVELSSIIHKTEDDADTESALRALFSKLSMTHDGLRG